MGKIKTLKRYNLRNTTITQSGSKISKSGSKISKSGSKISKISKSGSKITQSGSKKKNLNLKKMPRVLRGGADTASAEDYKKIFLSYLKIFDNEFKSSTCQAYLFKHEEIGFMENETTLYEHATIYDIENHLAPKPQPDQKPVEPQPVPKLFIDSIDKIIIDTREKLSKWNECLNYKEYDRGDEIPNLTNKPEKLFIFNNCHGNYYPTDSKDCTFSIPDNIVLCLLTKTGQYGLLTDDNLKSWLSIADYDDEKFEELFNLKIKNTTESFDNKYNLELNRNNCFQQSSWYYPGQPCYDMLLTYVKKDILDDPLGLYFIRPKGIKEKKLDRPAAIHQDTYIEGDRLYVKKNMNEFLGSNILTLKTLLEHLHNTFNDEKIMLTISCCRHLDKTKENMKKYHHDFYIQVINNYMVPNNYMEKNPEAKANAEAKAEAEAKSTIDKFNELFPTTQISAVAVAAEIKDIELIEINETTEPVIITGKIKEFYEEYVKYDTYYKGICAAKNIVNIHFDLCDYNVIIDDIQNALLKRPYIDTFEHLKSFSDNLKISPNIEPIFNHMQSDLGLNLNFKDYKSEIAALYDKLKTFKENKLPKNLTYPAINDTENIQNYLYKINKNMLHELNLTCNHLKLEQQYEYQKYVLENTDEEVVIDFNYNIIDNIYNIDNIAKDARINLTFNEIKQRSRINSDLLRKQYKLIKIFDENYSVMSITNIKSNRKNLFLKIKKLPNDAAPALAPAAAEALAPATALAPAEAPANIITMNKFFENIAKKNIYDRQKILILSKKEELKPLENEKKLNDLFYKVKALNNQFIFLTSKFEITNFDNYFTQELEIIDPSKYFYKNNDRIKRYTSLLEIIKAALIEKIEYLQNPNLKSDEKYTNFLKINKSFTLKNEMEDSYDNNNLLCENGFVVYYNFNKGRTAQIFKEYNPMASVFFIKILNFIERSKKGTIDIHNLIENLQTSSIGQISFLVHYIYEKSARFKNKYIIPNTSDQANVGANVDANVDANVGANVDANVDALFNYIYDQLNIGFKSKKIYDTLTAAAAPTATPTPAATPDTPAANVVEGFKHFKKTPAAGAAGAAAGAAGAEGVAVAGVAGEAEKFEILTLKIKTKYFYKYIFNKLLESVDILINKSSVTKILEMVPSIMKYNRLDDVYSNKVIQLYNLLTLLNFDFTKNAYTNIDKIYTKQKSSDIIISNKEDAQKIKTFIDAKIIQKEYKSVMFNFDFENKSKESIKTIINKTTNIKIKNRANWNIFFDEIPVNTITHLFYSGDYFIEPSKLYNKFPNLKYLEYTPVIPLNQEINFDHLKPINIIFSISNLNTPQKITFESENSNIELKCYDFKTIFKITCNELIINDVCIEKPSENNEKNKLEIKKLTLKYLYIYNVTDILSGFNITGILTHLTIYNCYDFIANLTNLTNLTSLNIDTCYDFVVAKDNLNLLINLESLIIKNTTFIENTTFNKQYTLNISVFTELTILTILNTNVKVNLVEMFELEQKNIQISIQQTGIKFEEESAVHKFFNPNRELLSPAGERLGKSGGNEMEFRGLNIKFVGHELKYKIYNYIKNLPSNYKNGLVIHSE